MESGMKRQFRGAAFAAAPFLIATPAYAQWDAYKAPRNAIVDASGAQSVEVEAGAGSLRVEGKPGLRQVQITGTARASSQQILNEIKLIAERRGDLVFIKADIPDHNGWNDNYSAGLDLVIEVPQGINAEVSDGSGDAKIYNVGALEASDGSGELVVDGAAGSVRITDGSGNLKIENVNGDVPVSVDGRWPVSVCSSATERGASARRWASALTSPGVSPSSRSSADRWSTTRWVAASSCAITPGIRRRL